MSFSPEEIRSRDFLIALRGFDKDEVATFLQEVASQYADLLAELAQAREHRESAPLVADPFADLGDQVASVMRAAADAAAHLQTATEREASSIRSAARDEAGRAAAEARLELDAASELRVEAEREAAQMRSRAREEAAQIQKEVRQELESAKETRATAERQATELRESAMRQQQEMQVRAEQAVSQLVISAKQEIDEAVKQVIGGCEGLHRAELGLSSLIADVLGGNGAAEIPLTSVSGSPQDPDGNEAAS